MSSHVLIFIDWNQSEIFLHWCEIFVNTNDHIVTSRYGREKNSLSHKIRVEMFHRTADIELWSVELQVNLKSDVVWWWIYWAAYLPVINTGVSTSLSSKTGICKCTASVRLIFISMWTSSKTYHRNKFILYGENNTWRISLPTACFHNQENLWEYRLWIDLELIVVENVMFLSIDVIECVCLFEDCLVIDLLLIESHLIHHQWAILSSSPRRRWSDNRYLVVVYLFISITLCCCSNLSFHRSSWSRFGISHPIFLNNNVIWVFWTFSFQFRLKSIFPDGLFERR